MQRIDRLRTLTKQEIQKVRFVFAPTHPVLAALDYRNNDLFRATFGSEDQLSNKILIAFLSDLLGIRIVRHRVGSRLIGDRHTVRDRTRRGSRGPRLRARVG